MRSTGLDEQTLPWVQGQRRLRGESEVLKNLRDDSNYRRRAPTSSVCSSAQCQRRFSIPFRQLLILMSLVCREARNDFPLLRFRQE